MLTGAEFDLANAGYSAMPDGERKEEEAIGSDNASLREAAEHLSTERAEPVVRQYTDARGQPAAASEAVTLARAARDYAGATSADRLMAESRSADDLAARVDALRAEALASDPDAAEFYGFEPRPGADARTAEGADRNDAIRSETDRAPVREDGDTSEQLDPELERAIRHPQVRLAIEEKIGEVEKARQGYLEGLAAATQIAQASFVSQFPELAGIAPEQLPGALELMSRQEPAKFARVQAIVATTERLFTLQQQENWRQAEIAQHSFQNYARSEDARLDTMLKGEPVETQRAVAAEIVASAKASGIEPGELNRLFNSEPLMRNAIFQRMMYDAAKYRLMMKARDTAAARPLPPVQRPGSARTPAERDQGDLRSLSARLSSSGNLKDAVALYRARRSGNR
jgi:hypothetical protein